MFFSIAHSTGWTIDYIYWHLSPQQLILFSAAANEVLGGNNKDDEDKTLNFDKMSAQQQDTHMAALFGVPIMEG